MVQDMMLRGLLVVWFVVGGYLVAGAEKPIERFQKHIEPVLTKICADCHGEFLAEGDFRIDKLNPDLVGGHDAERWNEVLNRINLGEMPPEDATQFTDQERELVVGWIRTEVQRAVRAREGKVEGAVLRRLNRREYGNTLRDLLGVPVQFEKVLPPDGPSPDGFLNHGATLAMSSLHFEYYIQIARTALGKAIVTGPPPKQYHYRLKISKSNDPPPKNKKKRRGGPGIRVDASYLPVSLHDEPLPDGRPRSDGNLRVRWQRGAATRYKPLEEGILLSPAIRPRGEGLVAREVPNPTLKLWLYEFPEAGDVCIRVRAAAADPNEQAKPILKVVLGTLLDDGEEYAQVGEMVQVTASPDEPQVYEFRGRLEDLPLPFRNKSEANSGDLSRMLIGVWNAYDAEADQRETPKLLVKSVDFEAPIYASWPPKSHQRIFFRSEQQENEPAYAREVLQRFMTRAYRRPANKEEVNRMVALWQAVREESPSFAASIRDVLPAVLSSPKFLYMTEPDEGADGTQPLSQFELAARLSYFLWSSMPDAELFHLAESGKLADPQVLRGQVRRMLESEKSWEFVRNFTDQWLALNNLDRVAVSKSRFPDFFEETKQAMRAETHHFFAELLHNDLSALNLIDSDFTMINQHLAWHYGIQGVEGAGFQKVELPADLKRGGLLAQGSTLTGGSTGEDSHPIRRGVWLLKKLLDMPPPPPPPNVPDLDQEDPKLSGLPVKKQLEVHRDNAACNSCHRKIDPWGVAFENYDAVGLWREKYHGKDAGEVDSAATLPGGTQVNGLADLKKYLLANRRDQFARCVVKKLLIYALGRSLELSDELVIQDLTESFQANDYKLRELIEAIVLSQPFRTK